ncbi:RNA polymerase sigma factor [Ornithinibacillus caprae]|uniref:RNA polymerase sigma factor n=1 Tax=Ornithinibacillus caprae TaxID=2678566 RepID=UPI0018C4510B|nr:RNA polymerase sigma factor [Ornithinibacillus caprae]
MNEEQLIKMVEERDESAFKILLDQYKRVVERFAFQLGVRPEYIPNIVQETFITLYRKINLYRSGKLSMWIYRITLKVTKEHVRKLKKEQKIEGKAIHIRHSEQGYGYYFEKEEHALIHDCLQKMDQKYSLPLILSYFHDQSYEDIGTVLKLKTSIVETRLHRAKKLLMKEYENKDVREVFLHG